MVRLSAGFDHWLAFLLLASIGSEMIWESFHEDNDDDVEKTDVTKGLVLITLSLATSIDALTIGLSFSSGYQYCPSQRNNQDSCFNYHSNRIPHREEEP